MQHTILKKFWNSGKKEQNKEHEMRNVKRSDVSMKEHGVLKMFDS